MEENFDFVYSTPKVEVRTSEIGPINIDQPCDGALRTYFEDLSDNTVDLLVKVRNGSTACLMTLVIESKNGRVIERPVPTPPFEGPTGFYSMALDNVKKVSIRCSGCASCELCEGEIQFIRTFCVGSSEEKKKSRYL